LYNGGWQIKETEYLIEPASQEVGEGSKVNVNTKNTMEDSTTNQIELNTTSGSMVLVATAGIYNQKHTFSQKDIGTLRKLNETIKKSLNEIQTLVSDILDKEGIRWAVELEGVTDDIVPNIAIGIADASEDGMYAYYVDGIGLGGPMTSLAARRVFSNISDRNSFIALPASVTENENTVEVTKDLKGFGNKKEMVVIDL